MWRNIHFLLESDDGINPASSIVNQNRQTSYPSMCQSMVVSYGVLIVFGFVLLISTRQQVLTQFVKPFVCCIKIEAFRYVPCPRIQQANLLACSPHYPF